MNKINLTKLKADAEAVTNLAWRYEAERCSAKCVIGLTPSEDRWLAHCQPEFDGEANGTHIVNLNPENALILIEAVKRAAFTLNELCACDVDASRCDACRTLDFMREQIDFGGGET